jgi:monovalent cation:proton antiporter-2 (CPA2) family protein
MEPNYLINVFVFLAAACLVVPIAARFKLGSVLGYLIAGVIIGPFALGLIGEAEKVMSFAEFGVVMMMFLIGMELEPAVLWRLRKTILGLGGLQVVLSSLGLMVVGLLIGQGWQASLAVGMALAMSSTALVMQMLREKNLTHTVVGETSFSVLLFQDMAVIPILLIIPMLAMGTGHEAASAHVSMIGNWPVWLQTVTVVLVIAGVILIGKYLSRYVFQAIAQTNLREVFTATSLALVIGVTVLMEMVGVSPALGAFIAGVVLANSEYRRTIETDIEPFKGLLLGLFFISVGMGMDFNVLLKYPLALLGAVVALAAVKGVVLYALGRLFRLDTPSSLGLAVGLSQGGEFAFVLLQMMGGLKLIDPEAQKFLILLVAISIALTPILVMLYSKFILPLIYTRLPEPEYDDFDDRSPVIIAGFGRFGQIVGRFMIGQGVAVTILEKSPEQVELLRKFGSKAYFGDATRVDLLRSAGAEDARMLIVAVDDADAALEIVKLAKTHFPRLKVFARARNRRHAYDLYKAGVDYYQREVLDSSITMAIKAMVTMGYPAREMERKAAQFRAHDVATLKKSFEFFESEPDMVNFAKLSRAELENILKDDAQDQDAA